MDPPCFFGGKLVKWLCRYIFVGSWWDCAFFNTKQEHNLLLLKNLCHNRNQIETKGELCHAH